MKPLVHPSIETITVEGILHALSDPVRAAIYINLVNSNGVPACGCLQINGRGIPKSTLSVHFRSLREAGLIYSERHGVEMRSTSRHGEIEQRFPGLLPAILQAHEIQAARCPPKAKPKAAPRSKRT